MGCKVLGEDNCSYCSKPGHVENDCFSKRRDQKLGSSKFKGGCAICKEDGHWKNECPKRGTDEDTKANGEEKVVVNKHKKKKHGETADGQCEGGATEKLHRGANEPGVCLFIPQLTIDKLWVFQTGGRA